MNKFLKFSFLVVVLVTLFYLIGPEVNAADQAFTEGTSLVPCGNDVDANGKITNPCDFNYILMMINKIVTFILVYLAVPIAAIMFVYAGYLLLFSGGESSKMTQAKGIFVNVAIGLVVVAGAWLVVKLVLSTLGYTGWNPFN